MPKRTRLKRGSSKARPSRLKMNSSRLKEEVGMLRAGAVDSKAQNYDWASGYAEQWEVAFPLTEEEMESEEFYPMMNYYYPLPEEFEVPDDAKERLKDLNITIIEFEETDANVGRPEYAFALTGGGMDLTWDIATAFVRFGYLPPVDYTDLPRMAGMKMTPEREKVILACRRSHEVMEGRSSYAQSRLDEVEKHLREG